MRVSRRSLLAALGATAAMPWRAAAAPGSGGEIVFATWGGTEIKNLTRAFATPFQNAGGPTIVFDGTGPTEAAVEAALLCRDHLMGSLDTRSMRILGGLVAGRSKTEIGRAEKISTSAVSQRTQRDGLDVIVAASAMLREIR